MIPRPPDSVFDTKIFQKLANAKDDRDGLAAKARRFIELSGARGVGPRQVIDIAEKMS